MIVTLKRAMAPPSLSMGGPMIKEGRCLPQPTTISLPIAATNRGIATGYTVAAHDRLDNRLDNHNRRSLVDTDGPRRRRTKEWMYVSLTEPLLKHYEHLYLV
ncbi:hypothetical protein GW17_00061428 [Ensete ventricosum]|nr:hypothetical protein GW17_00061428 [Ensete ventricosum]